MAVSKVTLNGSTLMDTTGVTVDESNLLTGNTALDNSGTLITGTATAGEDLPVFNITWNGSYPSAQPISITCNKTFAECRAMINGVQSSNYSAVLHEIASYTNNNDTDMGITGMTGTYRSVSGSESIDYFAGWESGIPYIKVTYLPNGTIESTADNLPTDSVLNATSNGTYTQINGRYKTVNVALPSGTEGTPVATKGTVSNHSVTVTPSVTNTAGVITGGAHTGTAVTVTASELDSGTKSIAENGTGIDVVGYAAVDVAVPAAAQYTAKIIAGVSSSNYGYIKYNDVYYYSSESEFNFSPGEECSIRAVGGAAASVSVDGVQVAYDSSGLSTYTYTLPSHSIEIRIYTSGGAGRVIVNPLTLEITSNGEYDVTDYAAADVNIPLTRSYTATIANVGTQSSGDHFTVTYRNTVYRYNESFIYAAGDTCTIYLYNNNTNPKLYVDDVLIASGGNNYSLTYEYTLPAHNIDIVPVQALNINYYQEARIGVSTLNITENGTYNTDVCDVVNVKAVQYTAHIIRENSNAYLVGSYNGQSISNSFAFVPGETCTLIPRVLGIKGLDIIIDGVTVYSDSNLAVGTNYEYTYTFPNHNIDIHCWGGQTDSSYTHMLVESATLNISSNHISSTVSDYDSVNVQIPDHRAVIIEGNNSSQVFSVTFGDQTYYATGASFDFSPGEQCVLKARTYTYGGGETAAHIVTFYVDGVAVYSGRSDDGSLVSYQYTLPSHNIGITVNYGSNYIGTQVYISALTLDINSNGEHNVSGYVLANVDVPPTLEALYVNTDGIYQAPSGKGYSPITVNTSGSGPKSGVRFIDYDGTILHEYTALEVQELSSLPANPSHTGLVAQGWNWSLSDIKTQLINNGGIVNVGQMYITASGKTEIDVRFEDPNFLSPYLMLAVNGEVSVDWGDNSSPDTVTGSSLTTEVFTQHVYSAIGNYTIKITSVSGSYTFYCSSSNYPAVLSVNNRAGYNRSYSTCVTGIRLGNGVTSIGGGAFEYCYALASVTIPDGVTSIGSYAFQYCYALTSVTIPDGVTSIGSNAFSACYSLTSVTIPDTVTSIGNSAFYICYSLTSISIPDGVTSIGSSAFSSCYSLTSISIPDTVTSIGGSAFQSCYSLTSISIPDGVTSIGSSAFSSCFSLASITIPDTVTSIGGSAFQSCYSLTSLTIPDGVTSIGSSAFQNCYSLTSLTIPSGCTVGRNVFQGCALFTSLPVSLPNDATDIKASEFNNCYSLTSLTIPDGVTSIGNYAFQYCYSLTSITIPDTVTSIGQYAFNACFSLASITIPDGVTSIGNSAFQNCYSMKEYHFQPTTPPTLGGTSVFSNIPSDCIIYVPYSADHSVLNAYKTKTNYTSQASKMQEEPQT